MDDIMSGTLTRMSVLLTSLGAIRSPLARTGEAMGDDATDVCSEHSENDEDELVVMLAKELSSPESDVPLPWISGVSMSELVGASVLGGLARLELTAVWVSSMGSPVRVEQSSTIEGLASVDVQGVLWEWGNSLEFSGLLWEEEPSLEISQVFVLSSALTW